MNSSPAIEWPIGLAKTSCSIIAAIIGDCSSPTPHPDVSVSRCRIVTGRTAGTVSCNDPSGSRSTRGDASSGAHCATSSSSDRTPSSTRLSVSAPPIGLVIEAIRNSVSVRIGGLSGSTAVRPAAWISTCPRTRTAPT